MNKDPQVNLFNAENSNQRHVPLAHQLRPKSIEDYYGQEHIFKRYPFLKNGQFQSLILWGPPGTGKTTLAAILASIADKEIFHFNAVLGGVADLKKVIKEATEVRQMFGKGPIIFIDEIHRFNKSQQDALLPYVETGEFTLIGATTENPKTSVNKALISRVQLIALQKLTPKALFEILSKANQYLGLELSDELIQYLARFSNGDARVGISALEAIECSELNNCSIEEAQNLIHGQSRSYDKNQDRHYDIISAFIKSIRGSDPDAALLWLAVMIDGGEDPIFIARRLIILASEDIGNADPSALNLAVSTLQGVQNIGMPEARLLLAQATSYLAVAPKSSASYQGISEALNYVEANPTIEVPTHLKNHHPDKKNYLYPHSYPGSFVKQQYSPKETPHFYRPTENGIEKKIKERLEALRK